MTDTKKRPNGMTLVELLVAAALSLLLLDVLFMIFWQSYKTNQKNYLANDMQMRTKKAVDTIKQDITKTNLVLDTYSGYSSDGDTVILKIPRLDASQSPIAGVFNYIIYEPDPADPAKLHKTEIIDAASTTTHLASDVSNLTFTYKDNLGNTLINNFPLVAQINLSLTLTNTQGGNYAVTYSTTGTLRNR